MLLMILSSIVALPLQPIAPMPLAFSKEAFSRDTFSPDLFNFVTFIGHSSAP